METWLCIGPYISELLLFCQGHSSAPLYSALPNFLSDLQLALQPPLTVFFSLPLPCCGFTPCHRIRVDSSNHCVEQTGCKTWQGLTARLNTPPSFSFTSTQTSIYTFVQRCTNTQYTNHLGCDAVTVSCLCSITKNTVFTERWVRGNRRICQSMSDPPNPQVRQEL